MTDLELLDANVIKFYEDKTEMDRYKKICESENSDIKNLMLALDIDKHEVDGITATRSVSVKESFNEDKLIHLLENSTYINPDTGIRNVCIASGLKIVKLKPYVDMDALEDALYKGLIPEDVIVKMNDCKEVKETVSLRVSKKKKKENTDYDD